MSANDRQPGGDHYNTPYQHWDFVTDAGLGYLTGCATKYLARFKKKLGVQDLEKADHYIEKRIELLRTSGNEVRRARTTAQRDAISRFVSVNCRDDELQEEAIARVCFARGAEDMVKARAVVGQLIERARKAVRQVESGEDPTRAYVDQARDGKVDEVGG